MLALDNARVLLDGAFRTDVSVVIEGRHIVGVVAADDVPAAASRRDLAGARLVPGFIDTQVNGGGDALFNDDPSVETIRRIGAAHASFGTTGFLPTLISDDLDVVRAGIAAVDDAIAQGVPGVLGIHIEGPFINVERKGIHAAGKIRAIDEDGYAVLASLKRGRTLVTLAPEVTGPAMVARLAAAGVLVSAGHTAGSFDAITAAIDAGLTGFTHLFNAMSQLGNREPGAVGAALVDPRVWCGVIVDGHHVSPVTLRLALKCKPLDRFMLVTDAMPPTGGTRSEFQLNGEIVRVDGERLVNASGTLAGAELNMMRAVKNTIDLLGVSPADAFAMASANVATFLGLSDELGHIAVGSRASLVAVKDDGTLIASWIDGATMM
ncbi:N-acetylglucosamine-6-phosphate deacetylase [Sphingomonas sp. Mn802worker]|uniref:N-acetylglucosamine-6-phosphate deacetylase n=1 Tax=Sphingomonas sp. Mn802worker TaxID=629773 RepID=UPI00036348B2